MSKILNIEAFVSANDARLSSTHSFYDQQDHKDDRLDKKNDLEHVESILTPEEIASLHSSEPVSTNGTAWQERPIVAKRLRGLAITCSLSAMICSLLF